MIQDNLKEILQTLPSNVKLVAVSKTHPNEAILEAYNAGQRIFGENKVQELVTKQETLSKDIEWHYIGHLQTNKIKFIVPFVSLIHAVDSLKLLKAINKEASKINRVVKCLIQFHIAKEESKFGMSIDSAREMLSSETYKELKNVQIAGVMGMATYTDNIEQINNEFKSIKEYFTILKNEFFSGNNSFCEISTGMSGDYKTAINQGSTMVRIGSTIFGERNYK